MLADIEAACTREAVPPASQSQALVSSLQYGKRAISGGLKMRREVISRAIIFISAMVFSFACWRAAADVFADKAQIETLIESGKIANAQQKIEELKTHYAQDSQLPCALFWIGRKFEWSNKYDEAKDIYQQIIQNHPADSFAGRGRIGLGRLEVLTLVVSKRFDEAQAALDRLSADFAANPDLPGSLYWIAERYRWADKDDKANYLYQQVAQNYPDNPYAATARLALARQEISSLIDLRKFSPAQEAVDKLTADFSGNSGLPEALYWIAREYEWESEYEEANRLHKQILNQYPASKIAGEARLGIARTEADLLIIYGKTKEAQAVVGKIKADFAGRPELADTLYEIAKVYDYVDSLSNAYDLQSEIAADYPQTQYSPKASIHEARLAVFKLIDANDANAADAAVAQLEADFTGHEMLCDVLEKIAKRYDSAAFFTEAKAIYERIINNCSSQTDVMITARAALDKYELSSVIESGDTGQIGAMLSGMGSCYGGDCQRLSEYLNTLAIRCYSEGRWARLGGDIDDKADSYFSAAVSLWERVFTECPDSPLAPAACFSAAAQAGRELKDYDKAIEYYHKTSDNWPDYEQAAWAQLKVADYLELKVQEGLISAADASPLITTALETVIEKYPRDGRANQARSILEYYQQNEPGSRLPDGQCR
jgi:TolA-binding protein